MKALKFLKHMKQTDTPYNFRECEINEAIAELEEAMKPKTCNSCYWWNDFYTQCNNHDNALAGVNGYGCNRYETKDTQC